MVLNYFPNLAGIVLLHPDLPVQLRLIASALLL